MFDQHLKPIGTDYTKRITLLIAAFVIIPFVLLQSGPLTYWNGAAAVAASIVCIALAWVNAMRFSGIIVPTLESAAPAKSDR